MRCREKDPNDTPFGTTGGHVRNLRPTATPTGFRQSRKRWVATTASALWVIRANTWPDRTAGCLENGRGYNVVYSELVDYAYGQGRKATRFTRGGHSFGHTQLVHGVSRAGVANRVRLHTPESAALIGDGEAN
jgi:hypothetical protein